MEDTGTLVAEALVTAEEMLAHPEWEPCELVRGKVVFMSPAGARHGNVAAKVITKLSVFVEAHDLGQVFSSETGFFLSRDPDTVRGPDAMFLSKARIPPEGITGEFLPVPPDLAVEVVSTWDTIEKMSDKAMEYIAAGVPMVWVADPATRRGRVFRRGKPMLELSEADAFRGEEILPGFELKLRDIF